MRRRDFLVGVGAAAAVGVTGVPAVGDGVALYSTSHPVAPLKAWAVGRSDYSWGLYFTSTAQEATEAYADWECIERCEVGHAAQDHCGDDRCDMCGEYAQIETQRSIYMDKFVDRRHEIADVDYWRIGWSVPCTWCFEQDAYVNHTEWPDPFDVSLTAHGLLCDECCRVYDEMLTAEYGPDLRFPEEWDE